MTDGKLIIIAASTGGPKIVVDILSRIPPGLPMSIVVVQHMLPKFIESFSERLARSTELEVETGFIGMKVVNGKVIVAPGKKHLVLEEDDGDVFVALDNSGPRSGVIPSADMTMITAAPIYRENALGVILTGMGKDGTDGFKALKEMGGGTVVQDEESSAVYGMPGRALSNGVVDKVLSPGEVSNEIIRFSMEDPANGYVEI
jgi:two-component system, chemotaxis family, protein-glutamate methylesterase/glutaminase